MSQYFIRTKNQEAFVNAKSLGEAFTIFVKQTPISNLGVILLGHTEYFPIGPIPDEVMATRATILLVKAGIWTEEEAKDFNEQLMGERIV